MAMEVKEKQVRDELSKIVLEIAKENAFMFDNIDSFVALSRENFIVTEVMLYPFDSDAGNYENWDKVGEIIGNIVKLQTLSIQFLPYNDNDEDAGDRARPDWEILTRILRKLRRKVAIFLITGEDYVQVEVIEGFARAIDGHTMISEFNSEYPFTYADVGLWCSTLATLPFLQRLVFGLQEPETEEQRNVVDIEAFKELLQAPALAFVHFYRFHFTDALCHATANALEEGSSISSISFESRCSFPDGGRAVIANALKLNTRVTSIRFLGDFDDPLCNTLAAVLLCNSTLRALVVQAATHGRTRGKGIWFSPIFLSLGMNTTLSGLSVNICDEFGDELCAAIRNGLAKNSTLTFLALESMLPSDDDGAVSARNALSFLHSNTTLTSLRVTFERGQVESYGSAFRLEAVKMIEENPFLKSLSITTGWDIQFEELLAIVSALRLDTTLNKLDLQHLNFNSLHLTEDEVKQLVPILMKNYGLGDLLLGGNQTVEAILRLNRAGRRYLIEDGSSISKGVDVLSTVSDDIDCVLLHLLENPSLCDRRAAETTTRGQSHP
jgi:hypothetical protein